MYPTRIIKVRDNLFLCLGNKYKKKMKGLFLAPFILSKSGRDFFDFFFCVSCNFIIMKLLLNVSLRSSSLELCKKGERWSMNL